MSGFPPDQLMTFSPNSRIPGVADAYPPMVKASYAITDQHCGRDGNQGRDDPERDEGENEDDSDQDHVHEESEGPPQCHALIELGMHQRIVDRPVIAAVAGPAEHNRRELAFRHLDHLSTRLEESPFHIEGHARLCKGAHNLLRGRLPDRSGDS